MQGKNHDRVFGFLFLLSHLLHYYSRRGNIDLMDHGSDAAACVHSHVPAIGHALGRVCRWKGFATGFKEEFII